ncbi:hypothetical protein DL96DRAFT_1620138 [Flagelloscypha sp. PMI_526]|nr:hypothetical protein DL96DRAFT_1620138 [Flagelloscypha sp. PMI_526]
MQLTYLAAPVLLAVSAWAQNSFTINTPTSPVVCQPLLISWSGGTPPYILSIVDGNNPTGPSIMDLGSQNGQTFTWKVNIAPSKIGLKLIDATGLTANSSPFDILTGSDTSCVGQSSGAPAASTPASGASSTAPAAGSTAAAASGSKTAAGTSSSASTSAKPNAASTITNSGVAGLVGAVLVAAFA